MEAFKVKAQYSLPTVHPKSDEDRESWNKQTHDKRHWEIDEELTKNGKFGMMSTR